MHALVCLLKSVNIRLCLYRNNFKLPKFLVKLSVVLTEKLQHVHRKLLIEILYIIKLKFYIIMALR